jgi:hypothetical protein
MECHEDVFSGGEMPSEYTIFDGKPMLSHLTSTARRMQSNNDKLKVMTHVLACGESLGA